MAIPHPLDQLRAAEIDIARDVILSLYPSSVIHFRSIHAEEPSKASLVEFLTAEHAGTLRDDTPRPPRQAKVQYDVVSADKKHEYTESLVDINSKKEVKRETFDAACQPSLTM